MTAWSLATSLDRQQRNAFPGFAYQSGNLLASFIVTAEALVADGLATAKHPNYGGALAIFSCGAFLAVIFFRAIGREAKDTDFAKAAELPAGRDRDRERYPAGPPQAWQAVYVLECGPSGHLGSRAPRALPT